MFAVEFETQINNGVVHIPQQFEQLYQHPKAKIIIMVDEITITDFLSKEKASLSFDHYQKLFILINYAV
jgi:hypothetical protein